VPDASPPIPVAIPRGVLGGFGLDEDTPVEPLGAGHIHRTWLAGGDTVLQLLNARVFTDPDLVMENVDRITAHLARRRPQWVDRSPIRTGDGALVAVDPSGGRWRAQPFVPGVVPGSDADRRDLRAAGTAFGSFLAAMDDLDPPPGETITRFHDLGRRCRSLAVVVAADRVGRLAECRSDVDRAHDLEALIGSVAAAAGGLPVRTVHNDAKLANVVLDPDDRVARAVLDLDTTMPGVVIADLGELVRSSVAATDEDGSGGTGGGGVDPARFAAVAAGYLVGCDDRLTDDERSLCPWAGPLLSFENAVRYLTDHLDGDRYFAVDHPGHNLMRARAQLSLTEDLVEAQPELAIALDDAT
jgi:N-acetylhexosamine 1-kinase